MKTMILKNNAATTLASSVLFSCTLLLVIGPQSFVSAALDNTVKAIKNGTGEGKDGLLLKKLRGMDVDNSAVSEGQGLDGIGGGNIDVNTPPKVILNDPDECGLAGAPPPDLNDVTAKEAWLDKFKPCGWYKEHCAALEGDHVQVIEANTLYPPNRDMDDDRDPGDEDLQIDQAYIVQFDVGLHSEMNHANHGTYSHSFREDGYSGVLRDAGGVDVRTKPYGATETHVEGETCLEIYTKSDFDEGWGDIHGSNYGCMGKCGAGCQLWMIGRLGGGYAKNCMKHDVCSAFKSVATGVKSEGACQDIDCGDEMMQAVSHCDLPGSLILPTTCNQEDFADPNSGFTFRMTWGSTVFDLLDGPFNGISGESACYLWTGWEKGQGAPEALADDYSGHCGRSNRCKSGRCDARSTLIWNACMPRKENNEWCNEDSDCISDFCGWSWTGWICKEQAEDMTMLY